MESGWKRGRIEVNKQAACLQGKRLGIGVAIMMVRTLEPTTFQEIQPVRTKDGMNMATLQGRSEPTRAPGKKLNLYFSRHLSSKGSGKSTPLSPPWLRPCYPHSTQLHSQRPHILPIIFRFASYCSSVRDLLRFFDLYFRPEWFFSFMLRSIYLCV